MRARPPLAAALALALALSLPAVPLVAQALVLPKVELEYDREADFSAFSTYSWKDPAAAAKDPQMHTRIIWYVERELEKKGLRKAAAGGRGDLFVRYYAKAHEGLRGTPTQGESHLPGGPGQLTTGVDFSKVLEGTLILELQRASDEKPVWRAGTSYKSIDKKRIDAETASAVRLLIAKYPPPAP
jgi:hypothetical protein